MTVQLIPDLGLAGVYTLKTPFAELMSPNVTYTCKGIRGLDDIVAEGLDPQEIYYTAHGIADSVYQSDLKDNVKIISLQSGVGNWLYVPSSYILAYPNNNGVKYYAVMLGVSLGALPENFNLSAYKELVSNLTIDSIGVTPTIKEVIISAATNVDYASHALIATSRANKITLIQSDAAKNAKLTADITVCRNKITELENYIKTYTLAHP